MQDIGSHIVPTLMALSDIIGKFDKDSVKDVRKAFCKEYIEYARRNNIPDERIGESYAEIDIETNSGVPIRLAMGKYTGEGKNRKLIRIVGSKGTAFCDISNNIMSYQSGQDGNMSPMIKTSYKGPLRAIGMFLCGVEIVEGRNPFNFDPNDICLASQEILIKANSVDLSQTAEYKQGTQYDKIFG